MRGRFLTAILVSLLLAACSRTDDTTPPLNSIPSQVTRAEAIRTAERYLKHTWVATAANAFHGVDEEGIHMDTPEEGFVSSESDTGWWKIGETNQSIPYMWGGFDTPESFDAGLRAGKVAGDMYSSAKRQALDDGVSRHAVGIDCSGFVSRCWNLPRSYSTRELAALCEPVTDLSQLKPGDAFNKFNAHVVLFLEWIPDDPVATADAVAGETPAVAPAATTEAKSIPARIRVYEAGGEGGSKVLLSELSVQDLLNRGFTAWRYKGMKDE